MNHTFNDISTFTAVVDAGGFSAAAKVLNVSRSAVAKSVSRLEFALGVRLLHRTTRKQGLTDDGQAFYEYCQRAINELRAGKAQLESGLKVARGKLRVSMPVLLGRLCIAPVLTKLASGHPELELDLNFNDRPVDLIEDGFDLVVRNGRIGDGSGLMARRIGRERMILCASPQYLAERGCPTSLTDVGLHEAIAYGRNGRMQIWRFPNEGGIPHELVPNAKWRFDDLDAISDAAEAGRGIAWLPLWLIKGRLASGNLQQILPSVGSVFSEINVLWPETPHLPVRVRVAIDALAAAIPNLSDA